MDVASAAVAGDMVKSTDITTTERIKVSRVPLGRAAEQCRQEELVDDHGALPSIEAECLTSVVVPGRFHFFSSVSISPLACIASSRLDQLLAIIAAFSQTDSVGSPPP